jgi:hypothetical protein
VVRAVVRQREVLLAEQASWVMRMQKALVQMNLQLTEVLTDVMGMTGQAIVRAIVAGERDPKVLARHRNGRVKASAADIERALTGNWRAEHLFVLGQALAMVDSLAQRVLECDAKAEALLAPLGRHEVELGGPGKRRGKNTPGFDARTALARWAGVDLTRINGLAVTTVMTILSEIGYQPGTPSAEAGRHEPVAQRLGARRVLSAVVQPHGQAACQYRGRPQARPHGVLHAHAGRSLRRSGPTSLRRTATAAQHRCPQAPRDCARFPDHPSRSAGLKPVLL